MPKKRKDTKQSLPQEYEEFLAFLKTRKKKDGSEYSERTFQTYRHGLQLIHEFFPKGMKSLTSQQVSDFKQFLIRKRIKIKKDVVKEGMTRISINHRIGILRRFVKYLIEQKKQDSLKDIKFPEFPIAKKTFLEYVLSSSDIQRLIKATQKFEDIEMKTVIMVLAYAGLRAHELVELPRTFLEDRAYIVGKGNTERRVFLPDDVKQTIKKYLMTREDDDPRMFPLSKPTVHRKLKFYAGQARMNRKKVHAHAFRHFCAKYLLEERGFPVNYVKAILGHKRLETTEIYLAPTAEEIEKRMKHKDKEIKKKQQGRHKKKPIASKPKRHFIRRIRAQKTTS